MAIFEAKPVRVRAYVIRSIHPTDSETSITGLTLDSGTIVSAHSEMTARYHPSPGDYWVIQSDGYTYINPKDVFERKYKFVSNSHVDADKPTHGHPSDPADKGMVVQHPHYDDEGSALKGDAEDGVS